MRRRHFIKASGIGTVGVIGGLGVTAVQPAGAQTTDDADLGIGDAAVTTDDGTLATVDVRARMRGEWDGFERAVHYFRWFDVVVVDDGGYDAYLINDTGVQPKTADEDGIGDGRQDGEWGGDTGWASWPDDSDGGEHYTGVGKAGHVEADVDWTIVATDRTIDDGNPASPAPATPFEANADGESATTDVRFLKFVRFYGENGETGSLLGDGDLTTYADGRYPNQTWYPHDPDETDALTGATGPGWAPRDAFGESQFTITVENEEASSDASGGSDGITASGSDEDPSS